MIAPGFATLVPQEDPIAEPLSLRAEKLGQSREPVHSFDLRVMPMAIGFTIAKNRIAPSLQEAAVLF
jgi:hypothetical protein